MTRRIVPPGLTTGQFLEWLRLRIVNVYHDPEVAEALVQHIRQADPTPSQRDAAALENYREEHRKRRDKEIGDMGGGG